MKFTDILGLLGGLALFLYGMQMMGSGMEAAAGNRMKHILERLTANRFLGVVVGAGITAVIQSSSATTVMVVGFVNSGMMTLNQAVWIIMGANIGTTITGQLIALDVGILAPLFAFFGVVMVVFMKKPRIHHYGQIIAGLGVLFIGMEMMSSSMSPLRESAGFVSLMTRFSNPVLGIIVGALFTAVIQSSSASIGILQTLADGGLVTLPSAVYVLFGQNIGTCITAVLASIGTSRNAKRATLLHLLFNVIGTTVFTILCMTTPLTDLVQQFTPDRPAAQIANMHTLFNVTTTLLLLPLGTMLAKLTQKILPEIPEEMADEYRLLYLPPRPAKHEYKIGTSAIVINGLWKELERMLQMVRENVDVSFQAILDGSSQRLAEVEEREEYIDFLNKELARYISHTIAFENNEDDSGLISAFFKTSTDLERIGDHAVNLCGYTKLIEQKMLSFSEQAKKEIQEMQAVSGKALSMIDRPGYSAHDRLVKISAIEQKIDDMTEQFRQNQIDRMRTGACMDESCVLYSEMLTDFERIGDHILNIGQELSYRGFRPEFRASER